MATPKTLSTKDVIAGFGVGHMTVYNWRKGSTSRKPLPVITGDKGRVSFSVDAVKAWAKEHGVKFTVPAIVSWASKPGPKPKADKAPAKKAPANAIAKAVIADAKKIVAKKAGKSPASGSQASVVKQVVGVDLDIPVKKPGAKSSKTGRKISAVAKKAERKAPAKSRAQIVGETNQAQPTA